MSRTNPTLLCLLLVSSLFVACGDDSNDAIAEADTSTTADVAVPDYECGFDAECKDVFGDDLGSCEDAVCEDGTCVKKARASWSSCDYEGAGDCQQGYCDGNGQCLLEAADDGTPCGQAAWTACQVSQCVSGTCTPIDISTCDDNNPCTDDSCDPATGDCINTANTAPCDDGNICTGGDVCADGACAGTEDLCQCEVDGDCDAFDDGDLCNGVMKCVDQICVNDPDTVVVCTGAVSAGGCQVETCNAATGACEPTAVEDYTACDDGDPCTGCAPGADCGNDLDYCESGVCNSGAGAPCAGCASDADCAVFDDGDLCNGVWGCVIADGEDTGTCAAQEGSEVVCVPSGDPCVTNTCNAATGACEPVTDEACVTTTFCDTYTTTCGEWPVSDATCAEWFDASAAGTEGDTTGATQACYAYHLDVAATMADQADVDTHCAHALGAADATGSAPCNPNLAEVATAGGFNTLVAALEAAMLTETIATGGPFTVFAPTDTAFEDFIAMSVDFASAEDLLAYGSLADVLLYHVVDGLVPAATVLTLTEAATMEGSSVAIDTTDGVVLNGTATVTTTDVYASNGIIHVIDGVLMPPAEVEPAPEATFCETYTETCGAWPVAETSCIDWWAASEVGTADDTTGATQGCYAYHLNVAGTMTEPADIETHCAHALGAADATGSAPCNPNLAQVATSGGFTTLVAALEAAQLAGTIANDGPFTVFAPTDEAFTAFIDASVDFTSADDLLAYDGLSDVLLYHVVDGLVPAATVLTLTEATTKQGGAVTIDTTNGVVLNGSINVTQTDVPASNGLIHVIDGVLMPPAPAPVAGCMDSDATNYDDTAESDDGTCTYDVTFSFDGVEDCDQVNVTGTWDEWSGWGAHPDVGMKATLGAGDYEFVILCVDTETELADGANWFDDVWAASTVLRPTAECAASGDGDLNYTFSVVDAPLSVSYCAGSCDETCPCVPTCTDTICADDGCGGFCGACDAATLTTDVSIADFAFTPMAITVVAGTTVRWTNNDSTPHSVESVSNATGQAVPDGLVASGTLAPGDSFSFLFETANNYPYVCGLHDTMTGEVTVVTAASSSSDNSGDASDGQ